jgi:hypothetical protein
LKESRKEGKKISWPKHQTLRLGIWEESKRFAMKLAIGGLSIHNHLTSWTALLIFKILEYVGIKIKMGQYGHVI